MKLYRWQLRKNILFGVPLITTLFCVTFFVISNYLYTDLIACYRIKGASLPDITEVQLPTGKSIFFHETSCTSFLEGKIVISSRQGCAVESAARMNPNLNVYLLYTSPGVIKLNGTTSDEILAALLSYSNIKILHIDYEKYTKNTPLENLYTYKTVEASKYARSHASDVLRYLTLWKYGGIYLDLDIVVLKSFENLPSNFAGSESEEFVAAGALGFDATGMGHEYATRCVMDLKNNFSGSLWGYNGPGVITRLLRDICDSKIAKDMLNKDCRGFKVYPPESFYPIPWWNWTIYFDSNYNSKIFNLTKNSFFIHVWNMHSVNTKIPVGTKVPYSIFAKQYCPKVFSASGPFF